MRKLKPSVKAAIASTLVLTSVAAIAYAVPKVNNEKSTKSTGNELKLEVKRIDSDTVKVAIDNIQDIPKALQFSIKLDGVKLQDGENSIKDLVKTEVETRLKNKEYSTNTNSILTDYTYNEKDNTIDVLITSENSLPKVGNKIEVFELDVEAFSKDTQTYKILPNDTDKYKYVSNTNKEYNNLGVTSDNTDISLNTLPTIKVDDSYIMVVEGETLELTPENLKEKIGLEMSHEDGNDNLTLEIKKDGKVIGSTFTENKVGIYELELRSVKNGTIKSEPIKLTINVALDKVTDLPTITMNGEELKDIKIDGGSIFKPLENVKAVDSKGREVEVNVKVDKELDLDPEVDTIYTLTYTATDIYKNTVEKQIKLTVKANKAPVILGVKDHILTVGDNFDPAEGVTVEDEDKDVKLDINSNVNTSIAGEYKVLYSATDSKGKTTKVQNKVTVNPKTSVINHVPVITAEDKTLKVGDEFDPKLDVKATDKEDGDITSKIEVVQNNVDTSKEGVYTVKYSVKDSKGATSTKIIKVTVKKDIVLASSININDKNNNKIYVGSSKTITAFINKEADIKNIDWKISDESIAELKINENEATIVAKSEGNVTVTASTIDGSNLSDAMTINIKRFENDSEIPSYIKDIININVLTPISGFGTEKYPVEFEMKNITIENLNTFLEALENVEYKLISISEESEFTVYKLKLTNKSMISKLTKLIGITEDTYIKVKVSKYLDNADDINKKLAQLADNETEKPGVSGDGTGNIEKPGQGSVDSETSEDKVETPEIQGDGTEDTEKPGDLDIPKTGDASILGYIGLVSIAVGILFTNKKRKNK